MSSLHMAFYGDDFTGSADVMEVLQWSGLRTVLFLDPPTPQQLAAFDNLFAFGVAGDSRTMEPEIMEAKLLPIFRKLRDSGAPIVHYKTCSTFDSSPTIGSIGKAIELGQEVFGRGAVPLVIAAPNLGRYQVFGNLFARSGLDTDPFRLDRHPTMRRHPITPMAESDLRVLLAQQTQMSVGLVDALQLQQADDDRTGTRADKLRSNHDVVLFDALYTEHLPRIGEIIEDLSPKNSPQFVVGSSGIEYALTEYWASVNRFPTQGSRSAAPPELKPTDRLVAITGSCSPVNARQIAWAEQNGFETIPINTSRLVTQETCEKEVDSVVDRALDRIRSGANAILHSSRGPDDPRIAQTHAALQARGLDEREIKLQSGKIIGPSLGRILNKILIESRFDRVGIAGGDSSGFIARELGIQALEAIAPVAPGSPLCVAYAENHLDKTEFFFKGGQVGRDDVWGTMLKGTNKAT